MAAVITPEFIFWLSVTLAGLLLSAIFNEPLQRLGFVRIIHRTLERGKPYVTMLLRIGLGAALVMQLLDGAYLAPEFAAKSTWVSILVGAALAALLWKRTLPAAGFFLGLLYIYSIREYGLHHALDYIFYLGIIYYLFVAETRAKETATPVLYLFTGLSLAWVGLEKMTIPALAHEIVTEFGIPTFGFSVADFVLISAFIEMGLAWTLIVGILNRFISLVVTLVFITTATVFGYTEIAGHTILHTLLIMFLIEGEGVFRTPFQFHHAPLLRYLFVLVNFCILLFGMMWVYIFLGTL
jgi:hypothetical protein